MKRNIDLLHEPILPALTRLALPIMATSLVQMAYNLTDMAWIGLVGADAVAAVGSAGMYTWFSQGVSNLAKMGGQVKVAHALGRGSEKEAAEYAQGAIQIGILFAVLFGVITVAFRKGLVGFFGMQSPYIIREAETYLAITCGLIIFSFLNAIFTGIFTACGDSKTPFVSNVIGLVINIIFDPVLIFGWGPFPVLGVAGAAIATVSAQAVVTLVFLFAARRDKVLFDKIRILKATPRKRMEQIVRIGFPSAVMIAAMLMVLTGCFRNVEAAYKTINWETIVLFAAMLPMSLALEKTGVSDYIAGAMAGGLGSHGPMLLMAGVYFATSLMTMFISNTVTAVLMAPIALQSAMQIGVSPVPFLFAVTVAASMCFASPFSTPPNALVMRAGQYTFMDYVKVGLPLQLIMGVVMVLVLPLLFPF